MAKINTNQLLEIKYINLENDLPILKYNGKSLFKIDDIPELANLQIYLNYYKLSIYNGVGQMIKKYYLSGHNYDNIPASYDGAICVWNGPAHDDYRIYFAYFACYPYSNLIAYIGESFDGYTQINDIYIKNEYVELFKDCFIMDEIIDIWMKKRIKSANY